MLNPRQRALVRAVAAIAVIWILTIAGYTIAKNTIVTAGKVRAYVGSVNLSGLSAADRGKAVQKLLKMLNALPLEGRQEVRRDGTAYQWFSQMNEPERRAFIQATMPPNFKQMLTAFGQMPEDRQRRMIEQTLRQLQGTTGGAPSGTNALPQLDPELLLRMRAQGLDQLYDQSSVQMQVELAPVVEELQRVMETGGRFRGRGPYADGRSTNSTAVRGPR